MDSNYSLVLNRVSKCASFFLSKESPKDPVLCKRARLSTEVDFFSTTANLLFVNKHCMFSDAFKPVLCTIKSVLCTVYNLTSVVETWHQFISHMCLNICCLSQVFWCIHTGPLGKSFAVYNVTEVQENIHAYKFVFKSHLLKIEKFQKQLKFTEVH